MQFDNVITDENIDVHPAASMYAMEFSQVQKYILGERAEEFSCLDPEESLNLINHLPDIIQHLALSTTEFAVLSLLARASWGQGLIAVNFCFLYYPDSKDTQYSYMRGLSERAFLTAFDNLLRRGLIRRVDRYSVWDLDTDTTAPPESFHYDGRSHCWTYAPALTYIDARKIFIAMYNRDHIKTDTVMARYFVELDILERALFTNFQQSQALWKAEVLKTVNSIPPENIKQHKHLVAIKTKGKKP